MPPVPVTNQHAHNGRPLKPGAQSGDKQIGGPLQALNDNRTQENEMKLRQALMLCASVLSSCFSAAAGAQEAKQPYVRLAELEIDPAQMAGFNAAIQEGVTTAVRVEPGVLALYAVLEKDHPNRVRVFEMYTDEDAYRKHLQTPHFRKFRDATDKMVKSRKLLDGVPVVLEAKPVPVPATNQPHAYYIAEFRITDPEGMKPYSARVASTFEPYGGRYIVRGGRIAPLEGKGPDNRTVIIEFDSMEQAQAWYDSPAYAQLKPIRHRNALSRVYIVEGTSR
jgi:uncharacterized protein (DUF1330 family)/quinol monooxygenase YgiN